MPRTMSSLAHLEPKPPGNNTSCTFPPKNKHQRCEQSKKHHSDDRPPFKMRRLTRADSPAEQDAFANIPDEIVLQIFKWLPIRVLAVCARICKRWKRISYDHSMWESLDLGKRTISPDSLDYILKRGVVALRLADTDILEPQNISLPSIPPSIENERFCKLQYLDLSRAIITQPVLEGVLRVCNNLQNLSLECCTLNDKICRYVGCNKKLEQLNLFMCEGITTKGINLILAHCSGLTALNLAWTNLSQSAVDAAVRNLPAKLERLNLTGGSTTLTDKHINELVKNCCILKELDLSVAYNLSKTSIEKIIKYAMELKSLALSCCYGISIETFKTLSNCPKLKRLEIYGIRLAYESVVQAALKDIVINEKPFYDIARPLDWNFGN